MTIIITLYDSPHVKHSIKPQELMEYDKYDEILTLEIEFANKVKISKFPNKLICLIMDFNNSIQIHKLPHTLQKLLIHNRHLGYLPELPDSLVILSCNGCNLKQLPKLPENLQVLQCVNNKLTEITQLPKKLIKLNCERNKIKKLPNYLPNELHYLNCSDNCLRQLPINCTSVKEFIYDANPICGEIKCIVSPLQQYMTLQKHRQTNAVNKIKKWFLDCKYNPKYKYCRDILLREHKELF